MRRELVSHLLWVKLVLHEEAKVNPNEIETQQQSQVLLNFQKELSQVEKTQINNAQVLHRRVKFKNGTREEFLRAYRIRNDNVAFDEGNFGIELNLRAVAA